MRIDLNARAPEVPENEASNRPASSSRSTGASASRSADEATLAGQARAQALQAQLQQMPDHREARIEALTRAIREGSYEVSADSIAQSLFAEMAARSSLMR